jgi:hypothetical protein
MEPIVTELTQTEFVQMVTAREITKLTDAVQAHLDNTARTRNYDNILSACTYATSIHEPFQMEGQACVEWRDSVWLYCYQVMYAVQNGLRALPTEAELLAEIPTINW